MRAPGARPAVRNVRAAGGRRQQRQRALCGAEAVAVGPRPRRDRVVVVR